VAGFPKVIVAIADTFSSDIKNLLVSSGWRNLCDGFMQELETNRAFRNLQGLFAWVHSYFHTCPDFLKPCIFYLLIFPADHDIRRKRLVRRWNAEGYSRDTKDSTAEENGEQFFSKLVKLSMIQVPDEPTTCTAFFLVTPSCQVNGFFREYTSSHGQWRRTLSLHWRGVAASTRNARDGTSPFRKAGTETVMCLRASTC
jgi:hypothetical protein